MAKHKHIINLSEVPFEKINAPDGSVFGGARRRVGAHTARKNWDTVFSTCRRVKPLSLCIRIPATRR